MLDTDAINEQTENIELLKENEMRYTISEAADRYDVTQKTLRHYEEFFNLEISRNERGRYYTEHDFELLDIIVDLKKKGLSLTAIKKSLQEKGFLKFDLENHVIRIDETTESLKAYMLSELSNKLNVVLEEHLNIHSKDLIEMLEEHRREQDDLITRQNEEIDGLKSMLENATNLIKNATELIETQNSTMAKLEEQGKIPLFKKLFG